MSIQQIVAIALRLFAIWLVMITIQVTAITSVLNKNLAGGGTPLLYALGLVPLLLALFLWRFPQFTARRLLPRGADTGAIRMAPYDATVAASAILGLWALINSFPRLVGALGLLLITHPVPDMLASMAFYFGQKVDSLAALAQCLLGLFLVAKPWYVARLVFRGSAGEVAAPADGSAS